MDNNTKLVRLEREGYVGIITLNRPERLNAWNAAMEVELRRLVRECSDDDGIRVIVLTGEGKAFCAGLDMNLLKEILDGDMTASRPPGAAGVPEDGGDFERRYSYLLGVPKPILCGLNGAAAGVGLVLSLYCDVRYASASAKLAAVFARRGLVAEHGLAWILPRLIGLPRAMEWLLSARIMDAKEAAVLGLVSEVFDDDVFHAKLRERAHRLSQEVSPRSTAVIKRQLYASAFQSLAQATRVAEQETAASLQADDFREGVMHFLEKRPARFTGR